MSMFREIPPTAGMRVYPKELLAALTAADGPANPLEDDFRKYLNVNFAKVTSSGAAALYLILEALKSISGKKTVIIPSYICTLVPMAIYRAGLNVEVCDITGVDFNYDPLKLERLCAANGDILAIVAAHIGGIPLGLDAIGRVASKYGIFLIEDCAQSLGARHNGSMVGAFGDFSFFSLCRGKGLTTYEGGVLVVNKEKFIAPVDAAIGRIIRPKPFSDFCNAIELFGYWLFYRPRLFWFVFNLPRDLWLAMGDKVRAFQDYHTADFPVYGISRTRQAIAHAAFYRLEAEIAAQRKKALYLIEALEKQDGIDIVKESPGDFATYPLVMVIFRDPERRRRALSVLQRAGLGASIMYLRAITDFEYLKDIVPQRNPENGRSLAARAMTLSTNSRLKEEDLDIMVKSL